MNLVCIFKNDVIHQVNTQIMWNSLYDATPLKLALQRQKLDGMLKNKSHAEVISVAFLTSRQILNLK